MSNVKHFHHISEGKLNELKAGEVEEEDLFKSPMGRQLISRMEI